MSAGGSKTTKSEPAIPEELQDLLTKRTDLEKEHLPDLGALFTGVSSGANPKTQPYAEAVLKPYQDAITRASGIVGRQAGSGGPASTQILQERAARTLGAAGDAAQSGFLQDILSQVLRLIATPKYPIGETRKEEHTPGVADYLNTVTNVAKAASSVAGGGPTGG